MKLPLAALVIFNLLTLAVALYMGWDPAMILFLYWAENVVVAIWQLPRFFLAENDRPEDGYNPLNRLFVCLFFLAHYGIFTFVHGSLVFEFFLGQNLNMENLRALVSGTSGIALALAGLFLSHGVQFFSDLGRNIATRTKLATVMMQPYRRIVILHLVVLLSGLALNYLPDPTVSIILLALIKIGMDFYLDRKLMQKQEAAHHVPQF
ncbi:DUF6498-containing protein [Thiolapillus sp.]